MENQKFKIVMPIVSRLQIGISKILKRAIGQIFVLLKNQKHYIGTIINAVLDTNSNKYYVVVEFDYEVRHLFNMSKYVVEFKINYNCVYFFLTTEYAHVIQENKKNQLLDNKFNNIFRKGNLSDNLNEENFESYEKYANQILHNEI